MKWKLMKTLGAFHVKTHLSQILKEIEEKGEVIAVTNLTLDKINPVSKPNIQNFKFIPHYNSLSTCYNPQ